MRKELSRSEDDVGLKERNVKVKIVRQDEEGEVTKQERREQQ